MTPAREYRLVVGDVMATGERAVLRTLLGSCVSACLWDEKTRIGGMNHFMLPGDDSSECSRFGVQAMELLIGQMQKLGADRARMTGKIFGGGRMGELGGNVPQTNVEFIETFMRVEQIPVLGRDLGGVRPRQIAFMTETGQAYVKAVPRSVIAKPVAGNVRTSITPGRRYGEVTLFGDDPPERKESP